MKRKRHTKEFESKVALAAIKGHQTANEIASEFGTTVVDIADKKRGLMKRIAHGNPIYLPINIDDPKEVDFLGMVVWLGRELV